MVTFIQRSTPSHGPPRWYRCPGPAHQLSGDFSGLHENGLASRSEALGPCALGAGRSAQGSGGLCRGTGPWPGVVVTKVRMFQK